MLFVRVAPLQSPFITKVKMLNYLANTKINIKCAKKAQNVIFQLNGESI
jgi:hypothetical protein